MFEQSWSLSTMPPHLGFAAGFCQLAQGDQRTSHACMAFDNLRMILAKAVAIDMQAGLSEPPDQRIGFSPTPHPPPSPIHYSFLTDLKRLQCGTDP